MQERTTQEDNKKIIEKQDNIERKIKRIKEEIIKISVTIKKEKMTEKIEGMKRKMRNIQELIEEWINKEKIESQEEEDMMIKMID